MGRILDMCLEEYMGAIGCEGIGDLRTRMGRQLASFAPAGRDDVDVRPAVISVTREGNLLPVRRPDGVALVGATRGEALGIAPRGGDGIEVTLIGKGNLRPIGRDRRVAKPKRTLLSG